MVYLLGSYPKILGSIPGDSQINNKLSRLCDVLTWLKIKEPTFKTLILVFNREK